MRLLARRPTMPRGTASVLAATTALIMACGLSPSGAAALDSTADSVVDGTLLVAHGDGSKGAMVMQTALRSASGVMPLTVPASEHAQTVALAGRRVQVRGSRRRRVLRGHEHLAVSRARGGDRARHVQPDSIHACRRCADAPAGIIRSAGQQSFDAGIDVRRDQLGCRLVLADVGRAGRRDRHGVRVLRRRSQL